MSAFAVDLHNHTPGSADHHRPETSAREIVEAALDAGLHAYAATDHLSCDFAAELIAAARQVAAETGRRLLVVPGVELRVTFRGDEAHITALFDEARYREQFAALMNTLGLTAPCPDPGDLPFFTVEHDPVDVARIIRALGGIACVAHADRAFGEYRLIDTALFDRLAAEPAVAAIDLLDPVAEASRLAGLDVSIIRCSDSHSCDRIGQRRSLVAMSDLSFDALRHALDVGTVVPELLV